MHQTHIKRLTFDNDVIRMKYLWFLDLSDGDLERLIINNSAHGLLDFLCLVLKVEGKRKNAFRARFEPVIKVQSI